MKTKIEKGQIHSDTHTGDALPSNDEDQEFGAIRNSSPIDSQPQTREGQESVDTQNDGALSPDLDEGEQEFGAINSPIPNGNQPQSEREGHSLRDTHSAGALPSLCSQIVQEHRLYKAYQDARKRLNNQSLAMIRSLCGIPRDGKNKLLAGQIRKALLKDLELPEGAGKMEREVLLGSILPFEEAAEVPKKAEGRCKKNLEEIAASLPVWPWVEAIPGFGALGLAQIVGETTSERDGKVFMLGDYENPAKLWKRMGVGLVGNERQRKCADKEQAEAHGYNPRRRSILFVIGESLIKGNGADGYYKGVYDERKAYEITRAKQVLSVAQAKKLKLGKDDYISPSHAHARAQRYMEKRLLLHLWQEWRKVCPTTSSE